MEKKNIEWGKIGFGYIKTDYRYSRHWENGQWDEGELTDKAEVTISECAGVLQYAQTGFEGLKEPISVTSLHSEAEQLFISDRSFTAAGRLSAWLLLQHMNSGCSVLPSVLISKAA